MDVTGRDVTGRDVTGRDLPAAPSVIFTGGRSEPMAVRTAGGRHDQDRRDRTAEQAADGIFVAEGVTA